MFNIIQGLYKRTTKSLIRLCGCTDWFGHLFCFSWGSTPIYRSVMSWRLNVMMGKYAIVCVSSHWSIMSQILRFMYLLQHTDTDLIIPSSSTYCWVPRDRITSTTFFFYKVLRKTRLKNDPITSRSEGGRSTSLANWTDHEPVLFVQFHVVRLIYILRLISMSHLTQIDMPRMYMNQWKNEYVSILIH